MSKKIFQVKFENQQFPNAPFDLIKIEELFVRSIIDHSLEKLHRVEFYFVMIVTGGQGFHTVDFVDYKCKAGSIITIRKDQIQKFIKGNLEGYILLFLDDFLVSYLEELEALKAKQLFNELLGVQKIQLSKKDFTEVIHLVKEIKTEYFINKDDYSLGIIRSQLHILLTKLYRIKSKKHPIVASQKYLSEFLEFQKLVEENCFSIKKVNEYGRKLGLSTKTLNNITQSVVHKSAKDFIDDIIITQIKRQLINSSSSIKQIAYTSGFEETTNFFKYFKRKTNTSPEQFRKAHK